ncbi:MAG: glycosyltransferase [Pseudomonadota bacterium]
MHPKISIIIPVFEQWEALQTCLKALAAQDLPLDQFEVIVVNNEIDADMTLDPVGSLNLRMVHEAMAGSYAARNRGIGNAKADILAFTDADCVPARGWLSAIVDTLDDTENARVCGPVEDILPADVDPVVAEYQQGAAYDAKRWAKKGWAVTGNMATRRVVIDDIGLFEGEMRSGGDRLWGLKAQSAGHAIVYNENMRIGHQVRLEYKAIDARMRRIVHGSFDVFARTNDHRRSSRMFRRLRRRAWRPPLKYVFRHNLALPLSLRDRFRYIGFRWRLRKSMYQAAKNYYAGGEGERR